MSESDGKLYMLTLLGASDLIEDGWMATDMAMAVALASAGTKTEVYSYQDFRNFACCHLSTGFFKYGKDDSDPDPDPIEVRAPKNAVVVNNSAELKFTFLGAVKRITASMGAKDTLIIFVAAHDCGDIIIGSNTLLSKDELKKAVDTKSQRIFWWSTSCDGEFWLEDVPWSGYAAQKPHKNRESLASHWGVRDLTSRANAISDNLTWPYKTNTMDNEQTDSSLSFPRLTDDILEKFRLVPYNQLVPDPLSTSTARSSQKASDTMREIMHAHTFEWPLEVDKDELLDLATPLLDYVPIPTSCNLQRIRRNLLKEDSSPGDIQILWNIFKHRQLCQRAIEMFLTYGPWGQTRAPDWNEFRTGKKLSRYFVEDNWESSSQLFIAYEWECMIDTGSSWPSLGFPEVWEQLALSWDLAGRPSFSFEEFQSVINQVHILKSSRICTHASRQVFSNWLDLQSVLDC